MEYAATIITSLLVTIVAAVLQVPFWILAASYVLCFAVGYGTGQHHRHHDS